MKEVLNQLTLNYLKSQGIAFDFYQYVNQDPEASRQINMSYNQDTSVETEVELNEMPRPISSREETSLNQAFIPSDV